MFNVVVAIVWANSSFGDSYHHLGETDFAIAIGKYALNKPLHIWINDGLMAIFFFVIILELKKEFMDGELSTFKKAVMPVSATLEKQVSNCSVALYTQFEISKIKLLGGDVIKV